MAHPPTPSVILRQLTSSCPPPGSHSRPLPHIPTPILTLPTPIPTPSSPRPSPTPSPSQNTIENLRLMTKKHECVVAPGHDYTMIVLQEPHKGEEEEGETKAAEKTAE